MDTTYRSVEVSKIQKAFALAHRCANSPDVGDKERKYFRAIALEIWKSCGEENPLPRTLPTALAMAGTIAAQEASDVQ
jgi:hypothetical protein